MECIINSEVKKITVTKEIKTFVLTLTEEEAFILKTICGSIGGDMKTRIGELATQICNLNVGNYFNTSQGLIQKSMTVHDDANKTLDSFNLSR